MGWCEETCPPAVAGRGGKGGGGEMGETKPPAGVIGA